RASTRVVALHSAVPSLSGSSVGIVKAWVSRCSMRAGASMAPQSSVGNQLLDHIFDRLFEDVSGIAALRHRADEIARLLKGDMRRQRRHLGISLRVDDDWTIRIKRLFPGSGHVVRFVQPDAF